MDTYIPMSRRFERGFDMTQQHKRFDSLVFPEDANAHYTYVDMDELAEDTKALKDLIEDFLSGQKHRLDVLDAYSKGNNHSILSGRRRLEADKSDYRTRHNWGGYISNYITGYIMGKPVTFSSYAGEDITAVEDINHINDLGSLNFELAYDASRFGRAFELIQRNEAGEDKIYQIDPREIFVVRSADVEQKIIGAVHLPIFNGQVHLTVYTADEIIEYAPFRPETMQLRETGRKKHFYLDVPVVEWFNNRFRQGDFENEIPLIDAYDSAQSDTANYMSDLNDALLVINGDISGAGLSHDDVAKMKEANYLVLESGVGADGRQTSTKAEYIYKQYDVSGTEAYKTRLMNDIYKLSQIPNLDDDRFYSGQSGVALQYKMIGLEQKRATKESFYEKALRRRYRLIANIHGELSDVQIDPDDLIFTFHPNIPEDIWAEVEKYIAAGGMLSQSTLAELSSFTDYDTESERLAIEAIRPDADDSDLSFFTQDRLVGDE